MRRAALPLLIALLAALPAPARAGSVSATVNSTKIAVGSAARLEITVRGELDGSPQVQAPPGLKIDWVSKFDDVSVSRGRVDAGVILGYRITGVKPGTWILGPAKVTVDGQTKATESFEIEVVERTGRSGGRTSRGTSNPDRGAASPGTRGGEYYAVATVSDDRPYVGESFTYEVEMGSFLRTAGQIGWDQPTLTPLSAEPGIEPWQGDKQQVVDGRRYTVNTIRMPVFAVETGAVAIDAARFDMTVVRAGRGLFGSQQPVSFESNPTRARIRPLPSEGRPGAFTGAVGRYRLEAALDRLQLETGETATLTIRVAGQGALRGQSFAVALPEGLRVYDEQPDMHASLADEGLRSEVIHRKALVPMEPGVFSIPAIEFHFFDPEAGRYRSTRSEPMTLTVTGEPIVDAAVVARSAALTTAKEQVEVLGTDILPLHDGPRMMGDGRLGVGSPLVLALLLLPLLGFGGLAVRGANERMAGTTSGRRRLRQKAARAARTRVKSAAASGDAEEAEGALRDYLTARLERSGAALSPEDGPRVLREAGAPDDVADGLGELLARIEAVRYGGAPGRSLADGIERWIDDAEGTWR
jgi:hypothetical protein